MGFFKKVFRPIRKVAKKIIPKEIRPFLPYAAAMVPGLQGLAAAGGITNIAAQKALIAGLTAAATDEDANILRTAALAGGPDALSQGLGKLSQAGNIPYGPQSQGSLTGLLKGGQQMAKAGSEILNPTTFTGKAKLIGGQTAVDQSAKFAEIRQDEIDEYNRNLLEQGVASKVDRRKAIFGIYKNAGYDDDYVNTMLDTYGYAGGGITTLKRGLVDQAGSYAGFDIGKAEALANARSINDVMPAFFKKRPKKKTEIVKVEGEDEDEEGNKKSTTFNINIPKSERSSDLSSGLMAAMDGVQKAYGRSFGEMEPTEFKRFAQGGDVMKDEMQDRFDALYKDTVGKRYPEISIDSELDRRARKYMQMGGIESAEAAYSLAEQELTEDIMSEYPNLFSSVTGMAKGGEVEIEEQTDDLGIMDLMRDQGVEYGEQVSNAQNDELLEKLFEEFIDLGFSPEDAARKAREAFDNMSQGQGIEGTQVASGYKSDIEEMYEQYVFEMEEQGLQPMDFASYLRQAQAGMAKGGIMNKNLLNTGVDKDMRGGGFIPEGTKEKADDVPARLSKNEFVMTADAVRAAGGGSVNEGAKRMYDAMHKLEAKV